MFFKPAWRSKNEERALAAVEKSMDFPLAEEAFTSIICFLGNTLKQSKDAFQRTQAAQILLALYKKHKRENIRAYNGTNIEKVYTDHSGHHDSHSDDMDCYMHQCNHYDSHSDWGR